MRKIQFASALFVMLTATALTLAACVHTGSHANPKPQAGPTPLPTCPNPPCQPPPNGN
jgi:hypothetical protein